MGGKDFFKLSPESINVNSFYIDANIFDGIYNNGIDIERNSLLLHYVIDNPPFAFQKHPLLYDQIRQFIAMKIEVSPNDIKLIGSAKTGFSISIDEFGRQYNPNSDLDFAIINKTLFNSLQKDYKSWVQEFKAKRIFPKSEKEEQCWNDNVNVVRNNIERNFIDANKLPALEDVCPNAQLLLHTMWLVKKNLENWNGIIIRKASARVYSNFSSFYGQTLLNISHVMNNRLS